MMPAARALVEAVGIEPCCQRYANPTWTLGLLRIALEDMQSDLLLSYPAVALFALRFGPFCEAVSPVKFKVCRC